MGGEAKQKSIEKGERGKGKNGVTASSKNERQHKFLCTKHDNHSTIETV